LTSRHPPPTPSPYTTLFRSLGVPLSPHTVARLVLYLQELVRWNAKVNLSGLTEEADIITKHFLDSLAAFKVLKVGPGLIRPGPGDRKSTRLNSSHVAISYAV